MKDVIEEESKFEVNHVYSIKGGIKKKNLKETNEIKKYVHSNTNIHDTFLSNNAQKRKDEIRKMTLFKRKEYGKMIQKQVLKMHKKKTLEEKQVVVNRYSQGSENVRMSKKTPDSLYTVSVRMNYCRTARLL
jgi:tRNA isopentenyl-2-thiomethyl-A-37 hydroxylase MiaE